MNNLTTQEIANETSNALTATALQSIGLSLSDMNEIKAISESLQGGSASVIHAFGRDASKKSAAFADSLLEEVRNTDLDKTGKQLTDVVRVARSVDLKQINNRSNIPVIGGLINLFRGKRGDLVQAFSSTRDQVDALIVDIGKTQASLGSRSDHLEAMLETVRDEYRDIGMHIAGGELALEGMRMNKLALAQAQSTDPMHAQHVAELSTAESLLEKRVSDLRVLQHAALQSLPTIRLIQSQNQVLRDKFENIKELTIPAWKRQFVLQIALREQENAVKLSKAIDDTTNDMLRSSADLLHDNAVATAKSNQRLVIDVDTLRYVHTQLIETLQDVQAANEDGLKERRRVESDLLALRNDLQARMSAQGTAPTKTLQ